VAITGHHAAGLADDRQVGVTVVGGGVAPPVADGYLAYSTSGEMSVFASP
jgi:hypothetical protein